MKRIVFAVALMLLLTCAVSAGADTLEQVVSRSGTTFYVMEGKEFNPIEKIISDGDDLNQPFYAYIANHENARDHIAQIDRSKQSLVYSSDKRISSWEREGEKKSFVAIIRTRYCYPFVWDADWIVAKNRTPNHKAPVEWIDEVKGKDGTFLSMTEYLNDSGNVWAQMYEYSYNYNYYKLYMLTSFVEGEELTVCEYVGTRLHEETIKLDALLLTYNSKGGDKINISCPVVKTRDGYFIIDISALPVGRYVIDGHVVDILN